MKRNLIMWLLPILILIVIGAGVAAAVVVSIKDTFTVTFDSNGGTEVASQTIIEGNAATEPDDPTRDGYVFDGWYLDGEAYDFTTAVTSDITLEAQWAKLYTVTFNSNGGTEVASQSVKDGNAATEPEEPTLDGYAFDGWYLNGVAYDFTAAVTSDITLEAQWTKLYTVTFDSNGGTEVASQSVREGSTATEPADCVYFGYNFVGWYLGDEEYDFTTPVTSDITLVAQWEKTNDMVVGLSIDTTDVTLAFTIGDEFSAEGLVITATLYSQSTLTEYEAPVSLDSDYITIDDSEFDSTAAGTYTIYIGCTLNDYTRWASYEVTVSSAISGIHAIELTIDDDATTYSVATGDDDRVDIDLSSLTVYSVNEDGTLGDVITEGITYKYFVGAEEVSADELNNSTVRTFQIWAYVDYTVGGETYVMSDFVLVEIQGNVIDSLTFLEGTTTQEQSYTDSISSTWVITADYSLTGAADIDLSEATIGTGAGQYTVTNLITSITGTRTATLTYYYQVGTDLMSVSCEISYTITAATTSSTFSAIIDVNAGTDDGETSYAEADYVITSVADGDEIVASMVYSNGLSGVNTENKSDEDGNNTLYGRVQFGSSKGVTLYLAGPATITLYARFGTSNDTEGGAFVLYDESGENVVATSKVITNSSAYEIVTITVESAGTYILLASRGSLNTFRIEISGEIVVENTFSAIIDVNVGTADDSSYAAATDEITADTSDGDVIVSGMVYSYGELLTNTESKSGANGGGALAGRIQINSSNRGLKLVLSGPATITLYARYGSSSGDGASFVLYDENVENEIATSDLITNSSAYEIVTITVESAGTYILLSSSGSLNTFRIEISGEIVAESKTSVTLNANDLDTGDITEVTDVSGDGTIVIMATSDNAVTVESNSKTWNGITFTQRIKLNGTGKIDYRSIKIVTSGAATITVYALSGSSSADRTLNLYDESFGTVLDSGTAAGTVESDGLSEITYTVDAAGTYYIASAGSGINIYYIEVSYTSGGEA